MDLLSLGGSIVGGLMGQSSAKAQNKAAAAAQERANAFTKEQMQNRHQWEVADLKLAGLNPVLSAGGTPSMGGSSAAPVVGEMESSAKGIESALSAASLKKMDAEIGVLNQEEKNKKDENANIRETFKAIQTGIANTNENTRGASINNNLNAKYGDENAIADIWQTSMAGLGPVGAAVAGLGMAGAMRDRARAKAAKSGGQEIKMPDPYEKKFKKTKLKRK